jgi:hypothetical protein
MTDTEPKPQQNQLEILTQENQTREKMSLYLSKNPKDILPVLVDFVGSEAAKKQLEYGGIMGRVLTDGTIVVGNVQRHDDIRAILEKSGKSSDWISQFEVKPQDNRFDVIITGNTIKDAADASQLLYSLWPQTKKKRGETILGTREGILYQGDYRAFTEHHLSLAASPELKSAFFRWDEDNTIHNAKIVFDPSLNVIASGPSHPAALARLGLTDLRDKGWFMEATRAPNNKDIITVHGLIGSKENRDNLIKFASLLSVKLGEDLSKTVKFYPQGIHIPSDFNGKTIAEWSELPLSEEQL